jgi:hypothetical protein
MRHSPFIGAMWLELNRASRAGERRNKWPDAIQIALYVGRSEKPGTIGKSRPRIFPGLLT